MINNAPLSPPFRVYLLDDHKFVTEILTQKLSTDPNIKVVRLFISSKRNASTLRFSIWSSKTMTASMLPSK